MLDDLRNQLTFLSIQAQDFIEDTVEQSVFSSVVAFLSIQAQDFIEEPVSAWRAGGRLNIPEHSSSGLH